MQALLLISAALLGLLAFFEPCTIATHSLYAARLHQAPRALAWRALLVLWLTRSVLCGLLLTTVVAAVAPVAWGAYVPSAALTVMGLVYIASRFAWIPVPHLECFRALPGGAGLPASVQLGLTLPACTLPLLVVVAGLAIAAGSVGFALAAGLLFATFFTAPVAVVAHRGLSKAGRGFLQRAAQGSPYLSAVLLMGAALYILFAQVDVGADVLRDSLQQAGPAGIGLAFLAGLVFSFNPVSFAAIPVVLAYVTKARAPAQAVRLGGAFVLGMVLTHVILGVAAALGGEWVQGLLGRVWGLLLGPVLIVLGLLWPGWLKLRLPWFSMRVRRVSGMAGAFLLAVPFSVAVCPFCTPALLVTLTASAAVGSVGFGFALLLAFALGRSLPILLGAYSMGWLESLRVLSRWQKAFEWVAGLSLVATGLYLLNEYFFIIP